jgi:DNA invertase Pin-like site-specific DNA recombinase
MNERDATAIDSVSIRQDKEGLMRAAIYVRSTMGEESERDRSLENQIQAGRAYAQVQGLAVIAVFQDQGVGGAANNPSGLDALRDAIAHGRLDAAIVTELSRLTRCIEHREMLRDELARARVALHVVEAP